MPEEIKTIYYYNEELQMFLPCSWNKTFQCYTPDLYKKYDNLRFVKNRKT
jgi:hypothetical protein